MVYTAVQPHLSLRGRRMQTQNFPFPGREAYVMLLLISPLSIQHPVYFASRTLVVYAACCVMIPWGSSLMNYLTLTWLYV